MVPNGWKKTHLKCVISGAIKNGYSPLPASTTTGYWVLSLGALTDHGINPLEIKPVVVDEKVKNALLSDGDFLISRSNTPDKVGRSIRFKNEVKNCSYPDLMMRFCVDTKKADPNFIEIKLKSTEVRQYYKSCAAGSSSSMVKINKAVVENTPLLLPSFPEQKKIAQVLSTWDKAISTTEQLLANSQQQKKALMQQLLTGKKRLLANNGVRFSGEWQQCIIEDFFDVGSSKRVLQDDWKNEGTPFYRTRELVSLSKNEPFRSEVFIADELFHELSIKYGAPKPGDFLVSGVGTLGISYQVKDGDRFYFKDGNVLWFKIKEGLLSDYFKYCFQSDFLQEQIVAQASITTVGTYTIQNAKKTKFWCPPSIAEQQKISAVLSTADQEIVALQQKLDALKQEKMALMQQLLTGKKRVIV